MFCMFFTLIRHMIHLNTGLSKKNLAKFGDTCYVRADGLCIGCLSQWAERGWEDSNMQEFFLHDPVHDLDNCFLHATVKCLS